MTEVISNKYVLSDSMKKTRPGTDIFYRTDANGGLNDIKRFQLERNRKLHKYPPNRGASDAKSFESQNDSSFKRFEDEGTQRCNAPYRDYDNIVDPISGFIGAGAAFDRALPRRANTAYAKNDGPQYNRPQDVHSIRKGMPGVYPEIDREHENEPRGLFVHQKWMSPGCSRGQQGGWTSAVDQTPESAKLTLLCHLPKSRPDMSEQDRLAYKYIYTSTTHAAYEDVPFEHSATGGYRRFPPTRTLERHADPVSLTNGRKATLPPAEQWCSQSRGLTWDFKQLRPDYFNRQRPFTYCSPMRQADQSPSYSGCVGSEKPEEFDNPHEPQRPFTVLRTQQPKFGFSGAPRDIPGYTGHRGRASGAAAAAAAGRASVSRSAPASRQSVTSSCHRQMPADPASSQHGRRDAELSKMVTGVPPHNPFKAAAQK